MNTIGNMQIEMDFYGYYKMFEYKHDLVGIIVIIRVNFTQFHFFKRQI